MWTMSARRVFTMSEYVPSAMILFNFAFAIFFSCSGTQVSGQTDGTGGKRPLGR